MSTKHFEGRRRLLQAVVCPVVVLQSALAAAGVPAAASP